MNKGKILELINYYNGQLFIDMTHLLNKLKHYTTIDVENSTLTRIVLEDGYSIVLMEGDYESTSSIPGCGDLVLLDASGREVVHKFTVTMQRMTTYTVEVQASTESEAIELAEELILGCNADDEFADELELVSVEEA